MGRITETVKHLIIINFIVWIGSIVLSKYINIDDLLALHFPVSPKFQPWQIFTHMFMHSRGFILHIFANMLALYMFGSPLEQMWGRNKFLFFYFSTGLGAVFLPFAIDYFQYISIIDVLNSNGITKSEVIRELGDLRVGDYWPDWVKYIGLENGEKLREILFSQGVGASGCTMGLLVAFGMSFPNTKLMMLFFPIPIKAKYFIPLTLAYELISGIIGGTSVFGVNVAHFAHIGGALTGFLIMWYWKKNQFNKNRWN